jgi:hypothetical protein
MQTYHLIIDDDDLACLFSGGHISYDINNNITINVLINNFSYEKLEAFIEQAKLNNKDTE